MIELYRVVMPSRHFYIQVNDLRVVGVTSSDQWIVGKSFVSVCEWIAKEHGTIKEEETM